MIDFFFLQHSSKICDSEVEPQPLWEYPGKALSTIEEICRLDDLSDLPKDIETNGIFNIDKWVMQTEKKNAC